MLEDRQVKVTQNASDEEKKKRKTEDSQKDKVEKIFMKKLPRYQQEIGKKIDRGNKVKKEQNNLDSHKGLGDLKHYKYVYRVSQIEWHCMFQYLLFNCTLSNIGEKRILKILIK